MHCLLYVVFHGEEVGPGYAGASDHNNGSALIMVMTTILITMMIMMMVMVLVMVLMNVSRMPNANNPRTFSRMPSAGIVFFEYLPFLEAQVRKHYLLLQQSTFTSRPSTQR